MDTLNQEMHLAIDSLVEHIKSAGYAVDQKSVVDSMTRDEVAALLFGWLSAKGLFHPDVDTDSFLDALEKIPCRN